MPGEEAWPEARRAVREGREVEAGPEGVCVVRARTAGEGAIGGDIRRP